MLLYKASNHISIYHKPSRSPTTRTRAISTINHQLYLQVTVTGPTLDHPSISIILNTPNGKLQVTHILLGFQKPVIPFYPPCYRPLYNCSWSGKQYHHQPQNPHITLVLPCFQPFELPPNKNAMFTSTSTMASHATCPKPPGAPCVPPFSRASAARMAPPSENCKG